MKQTRPIIAVVIALLFAGSSAMAQSFDKARMDSLFQALETKHKAMGSLCIRQNGKEVYQRSIGYSVLEQQQKASSETKYRIGSITKMFTAAMILQLTEEKKLSLTTPLATFFPQIPNASKITIGHMLQHRSGIHNFTDDAEYPDYMLQPKTEQAMLDIIIKGGSDFLPDTKTAYSNANYVLLGYIIKHLTKKPYAKALQERICAKAGLKSTYLGSKPDASKKESRSYQYVNDNWQLMPETDMSIPGGAGAILSTPDDLDRFIEALFAGKLVAPSNLELMKTIKDGYGMGMFIVPFGSKVSYGHNGGIDGFSSLLSYFPDDHMAIAYCTNGKNYPVNDILIGVLSIYYNQSYAIPSFNSVAMSEAQLDQYTGVYASKQLPLKITIRKDGTALTAQATGQEAFPLEATTTGQFRFDAAGIVLEFRPQQKEMTLKQGGGEFLFTKE